MDLTVVVISFNTRSMLATCLTLISAQVSDIDHEIVVVDNGSDDGSPEMVARDFPHLILIRNSENRGFAAAVNQAIRASVGRCVLLLNSDATLIEGAAHTMLSHLETHPKVGAVGGMLLNPDGSFQASYADFPTLLSETLLLSGLSRWLLPPSFPSYSACQSHERRSVDWICGAVLMLRRAAIEDVGLLDEQFFMYAEEVDWCRRAARAGWSTVYLPEARATHLVGGSYQRVPTRRREQIYRSKWLYFRKNHGWLQASAFRLLVHGCSLVKLIAWLLPTLGPSGPANERARSNVSSYRYLLSHF
jgi:N-acetylglucosaminyl-diphospho-decaprenol L-rhamnosyltransferase